jgi:exodeoxyribonuclease V
VDGDFGRRLTPDLSVQQKRAHDAIVDWLSRGSPQVFHLAGVAGSGKTELVVRIGICFAAQFAAYTGKAASVLRARGAANAATLHGILYGAPIGDDDSELIWRCRDEKPAASLFVADECSQIDGKLGRDLLKAGIKVLVTGDPFQLPPVCGDAFFNGEPDFTLSEIHRQASGSQPLQLATAIREGRRVSPVPFDLNHLVDADVVICELNRTWRHLNRMIRIARGIADPRDRDRPQVGDRIVCLRNNRASGVFNGSLWTIRGIAPVSKRDCAMRLTIEDDIGSVTRVVAHEDPFYGVPAADIGRNFDVFDFGYALTCHKAQGSEWDRVVVVDETDSPGFRFIAGDVPLPEFRRRWLYTAVTRAKLQVIVMRAPR